MSCYYHYHNIGTGDCTRDVAIRYFNCIMESSILGKVLMPSVIFVIENKLYFLLFSRLFGPTRLTCNEYNVAVQLIK